MGLLKHKGQKKVGTFLYSLHIHALSWPKDSGSLCVVFQRGSHSGATRRTAPSPRGTGVTYVFEEQLSLPVTLYKDAAAARQVSGRGLGPFLPKELRLAVLRADSAGKPAGPSLGSVTLNLADYAAADGRTQQAFTLEPGNSRLLVTIGCRDASAKGGGAPLSVEPSLSSLEMEEEGQAGAGGLPVSLSTDEEGGSRATSPGGYSRPGSSAAVRAGEGLPPVPEEASRPALVQLSHSAGGPFSDKGAAVAAAVSTEVAAHAGGTYDDDGFILDAGDAMPQDSQHASASVRRNLGSALEQAEGSEAGSLGTHAAGTAAVEVQSQLRRDAALVPPPAAGGSFSRLRTGGAALPVAVPATPAAVAPADDQSPHAGSTGEQSSVLSAAPDPAVPFSVPPSTSRRFAQRDGAGAAGSRRWAWRREGGGTVGAAAGAGASTFQRARLASSSRPESPVTDAADSGAAAAAVERSAQSAASMAHPSIGAEVPAHTAGSDSIPAAAQTRAGAAAGAPAAASAFAGPGAGLSQFQPTPPQFGGANSASDGAGYAAAQRHRSSSGLSGLGIAPLRTALSLLAGEPSAADPGAAPPSPYGTNSLLLETLLRELRVLAALESAVYCAGGRGAYSGGAAQLHAPARRLARTVISLGPREGLAFGEQAIRAIQATAGAASGDMHRLAFWWSNVLQLRWMLWALCHGQGMEGTAAATTSGGPERRASDTASPRASLAAAAAAHDGHDWMQELVPQLRDLEAWLFSEQLKHLWWRVLLQGVSALPAPSSAASTPSAAAGALLARANSLRAKSASHLAPAGSGIEQPSPASRQGTSRSFETPEEEAVQRWVVGLRGVEAALRDPARPAPAPRQHLALLHRQLIIALLRRLDTLLFRKLLAEDGDGSPRQPLRLPSMTGRGAFGRTADADEVLGLGGAEAVAVGLLEPGLLPFQRGALTFSTGVHLKMAVARLTAWAADSGVKEDRLPQAARSTEMSDYRLFPCLRATADLLMMPKEVLTDREMRREVVPGLPLHRICQLLQRFEPDDCAPDPLPPGLLEALQSESPRSDGDSTPSPTAKADEEYTPPADETLLADGIIEPVSLDMGAESEDELESLAAAQGWGPAAPAPMLVGDELRASRFALLRDLWATAR